MSVASDAFEVWRQADDHIALLEYAENAPSKTEWQKYREETIELLKHWRNRLRKIGKATGDIDYVIQRDWGFPEGDDDEV